MSFDPRAFAYLKGILAFREWMKTDRTRKVRVPYRGDSGGFRKAFLDGWRDAKGRDPQIRREVEASFKMLREVAGAVENGRN